MVCDAKKTVGCKIIYPFKIYTFFLKYVIIIESTHQLFKKSNWKRHFLRK
ncbi:hypothetical protein CLOSTMETH_03136 [[Clostridium] methylpentosum DSM 5476]|uniref:Uncharacterized protein n=1 Tax=[Clostridium] methylpentosum DSM 5476 TaxID=537013 RepID=C0EGZ2_9FIRM|nr:hypothetical protein CLOSTMETH_03136 [[Clostridium] methylpentosum DSM 5476]